MASAHPRNWPRQSPPSKEESYGTIPRERVGRRSYFNAHRSAWWRAYYARAVSGPWRTAPTIALIRGDMRIDSLEFR
jgi:hypothetical protein